MFIFLKKKEYVKFRTIDLHLFYVLTTLIYHSNSKQITMKKRFLLILSIATAMTLASCSKGAEDKNAENETSTEKNETVSETSEMNHEAEEVQIVKLEEVEGEFTTKELTLKEGKYKFEVTNNGIDHEVAFVLAPNKENLTQEEWVQEAMLTQKIADGQTASSKEVVELKAGEEYVYFCPLNSTPHYKLTVVE